MILLKSGVLTDRAFPLVAPLSESEIVILGGHNGSYLGDGYILNTNGMNMSKITDDKKKQLKFNVAANNQCAMNK